MAYRLALARWTNLDYFLGLKGVEYYFPKDRNDGFMYQRANPDGLSKFHIHSIEHVDDDDMLFTGLLAKSSNWRGGNEPDLATLPIDQWRIACAGMDSSTLFVVNALSGCFRELGATMQ